MPQQISGAPGPSQLPQPQPLLEMPEDKPDSPPSGALCNTLMHVLKLTHLHVALAIRAAVAAAHRSGASLQQQLMMVFMQGALHRALISVYQRQLAFTYAWVYLLGGRVGCRMSRSCCSDYSDAQILLSIYFLTRRVDNCATCFACAQLHLSLAVLGQTWCELQLSWRGNIRGILIPSPVGTA